MATEQFRSAVNQAIETWRLANFAEVPAFYENGPDPDEATVGPIWIDVSIRWYGAKLVTMGARPMGRHTGVISTNVFFRAAEGTSRPDQVIDGLKELLRARRLGGAVLQMPARQIPTDIDGWYKTGLITAFTLDDA